MTKMKAILTAIMIVILIAILVPLVVKAQNGSWNDSERELVNGDFETVIIGGGWAGVGAARTLYDKGLRNFIVLEGRDYIGGRSRTVPFDTSTVELGSQWIHGASTANPVYNAAQKASITITKEPGNVVAYSDVYGGSSPHRVPQQDLRSLEQAQWTNGFFPYQRRLQDSTNKDMSLRATADKYIQSRGITGQARTGLEFVLELYITQEYAASLQSMSTWWWDSDYVVKGGDGIIQSGAGKGYTGIIESYAGSFIDKIQLSSKVTRIDWSNTGSVIVDYIQGGVAKQVRARKAIITVPLGVLQRGSIQFTPSLPRWKLTAIRRLGMGLLNKLIMKWPDTDTLPWPSNTEWIERITETSEAGKWTDFYNMKPSTGKNILVAFSAGNEALRVEGLSDQQQLSEAMASMKHMYGDNIPAPEQILVTRWSADPFSAGSYSYYKVGSRPRHRKNLKKPLGDRLFFAGEACHLRYPSTTHGALLSGKEAAILVANRLQRRLVQGEEEQADHVEEEEASFTGSERRLRDLSR
jgi:monoamine oxidase